MTLRVLDAGDAAITIEFGNAIDPALQARVEALDRAITVACRDGRIPGLIEAVPTFRSLTLLFDPLQTDRETLLEAVQPLLEPGRPNAPGDVRHWRLPACYENVARLAGIAPEEVVRQHTDTEYVVYMLGFLPGFPFMGDVPEPLRLPRRHDPRTHVPAGSVAIATGLTAIYPWESPGGWHLIGRCPAPLFDPVGNPPALLAAGDRVRFVAVGRAEYERIKAAIASGELDPWSWCRTGLERT